MKFIGLVQVMMVAIQITQTLAVQINIFPYDVAQAVFNVASYASQYTANERLGSKSKAKTYKRKFEAEAEKLKQLSDGILQDSTVRDIQWMVYHQAWKTANERRRYSYHKDNSNAKKRYNSLKRSNELTSSLASTVYSMGWNIAWYWANTLKGYRNHAERDRRNYKSNFRRIRGHVTLIDMKFFTNQAHIKSRVPKVIHEQKLVNKGDITQPSSFSFEVQEGRTISLSHQFGFKFGVSAGVGASFFGVDAKFEASFEISESRTLSRSLSTGQKKSYTFSPLVPPHSIYEAKCTVTMATMDVPYELTFKFGTEIKKFRGIWKGVAVSKATYVITPVETNICTAG